jgi:chromosome partitioning protein
MIIAVASLKGGVGKTTTAIHLAAYLQNQADTLLLDADPNRSATGWSKRGKLPFDVVDERQPPSDSRQYDHVVIDTQARPAPKDLAVLTDSCDLLVLPTTPDFLALDALALILENLKSIGANRYRILLAMIPTKPSRDVEQIRKMLLDANLPIFATAIRNLAVFQKAAQAGVTVCDIKDPKASDAWQDYQQVGQELLASFGL